LNTKKAKTKVLKSQKMKRVKWKGPYIKNDLLIKINDSELVFKNKIKTMSKNFFIGPVKNKSPLLESKLISITYNYYIKLNFNIIFTKI